MPDPRFQPIPLAPPAGGPPSPIPLAPPGGMQPTLVEEEQYGPPLPPEGQRQWRIPSVPETMLRDMGMEGAAKTAADFQRGTVVVPEWLKRLDPLQGMRDLTGWELPTSEDVMKRSRVEVDLRNKLGKSTSMFESLPGDLLSQLKLSPIFPEEYIKPGTDPMQDMVNVYNRTRPQGAPREGRTVTEPPAEEPQSYLEPQEDGTYLTR